MLLNWSSVKNLLIAILIAANLFMLYNIARQDYTLNYINENEVANAVELLAEDGLIVTADRIPLRRFKAQIYESFYSTDYYDDVAAVLTAADVPLYMSPDGGLSGITGDGIELKFDTEFGFVYTHTDKIKKAAYTDITAETFHAASERGSPLSGRRMRQQSAAAQAFLDVRTADDSALQAKITDGFHDGFSGLDYLLAFQMIGEYEIHTHWAVLVFSDEELIGAHGRWYFESLDGSYAAELQDQVNILFTDLEVMKSEIADPYPLSPDSMALQNFTITSGSAVVGSSFPQVDAMKTCYVIYWNADKTALYFIPAWHISHINGDTIVYNAANGTIYSRN